MARNYVDVEVADAGCAAADLDVRPVGLARNRAHAEGKRERKVKRLARFGGGHAPSRSANSAKPSTTMVHAGFGFGSGGPAVPHSSGRRTNALW